MSKAGIRINMTQVIEQRAGKDDCVERSWAGGVPPVNLRALYVYGREYFKPFWQLKQEIFLSLYLCMSSYLTMPRQRRRYISIFVINKRLWYFSAHLFRFGTDLQLVFTTSCSIPTVIHSTYRGSGGTFTSTCLDINGV